MKILPILLILFVGVCFIIAHGIIAQRPGSAEWYAVNVFPMLSRPAVFLNSLIPISLTEFTLIVGIMTFPLMLAWFIYRAVCSKTKSKFIYRTVLIFAITFSLMSGSFFLMHGINYYRKPLDATLDIVPKQRSAEELTEVMRWLIASITEEQKSLSTDEKGSTMLLTDMNQTLADGSAALDLASSRFPVLAGNDALPKPVVLSHYWSYTGIVGMYFPFMVKLT